MTSDRRRILAVSFTLLAMALASSAKGGSLCAAPGAARWLLCEAVSSAPPPAIDTGSFYDGEPAQPAEMVLTGSHPAGADPTDLLLALARSVSSEREGAVAGAR